MAVVNSKDLHSRIVFSLLLISFTLTLTHIGGYYFLTTIFIILLILLNEFYKLFSISCFNIFFYTNYIFKVLIVFFAYYNLTHLILFPFLLGISAATLNKRKWFVPFTTYFYFALPAAVIIYLNNNTEDGKIIITWLFVIVWSSDIFGYVCGKIIKGPKLIKSISPNKTWSGFFSSIFFSSLASVLYNIYFEIYELKEAFLIGLIVSCFTNLGDLFEIYLKTKNNRKDSSNLIPGHGGLLDRLDGFLFAIVVFGIIIFFSEK